MKRLALAGIWVLLFVGCKNDENPTEVADAPMLPIVVLRGPQTSSTHVEAQKVKEAVNLFNYFTTSFGAFEGKTISVSGNTYTWTLKDGDLTFRLTATKQDNNQVLWKLFLDGRGSNGVTYSNWLSLEGTVDADLKNAVWVNYEENKTTKASEVLWTVSSGGILTGTVKYYSAAELVRQSVLTENVNLTGEYRLYKGTTLEYRAIWLASGNGQYWYYDANGQITNQGTWQ
ncbi:MAG TPA: hypothetical protein VNL36_03810 [Bacteroidota bacterium]|nr:hypothetical protein [Bacteroidota bacterium]